MTATAWAPKVPSATFPPGVRHSLAKAWQASQRDPKRRKAYDPIVAKLAAEMTSGKPARKGRRTARPKVPAPAAAPAPSVVVATSEPIESPEDFTEAALAILGTPKRTRRKVRAA